MRVIEDISLLPMVRYEGALFRVVGKKLWGDGYYGADRDVWLSLRLVGDCGISISAREKDCVLIDEAQILDFRK
jgi:hypothetical protein